MPRLEGTQTNPTWYIFLLLVLIAAAVLALELAGVIDLVPNFGAL